ncbi:MAG: putative transcriptional regulator [Candidatus Bathyarchaeota archaeon B63]|nr:MAG: putative transcriptional regulator [Candidatus Bathyarchaeota archaeon B63]
MEETLIFTFPLMSRVQPEMRIIVEEGCSICGLSIPSRLLHRCFICQRLCCGNCLVRDEAGNPICLRCAKTRVTPKPAWRSKYTYLREYLTRRAKYSSYVKLTFKRIEDIMGGRLPPSAMSDAGWWTNRSGRPHSDAWLSVGWVVGKVELDRKEVTFVRAPRLRRKESGRKRRKPLSSAFKALALKPRRRRRRVPSLTRIAQVQARAMNIARRRAESRPAIKLKPRGPYERRLYKPDERPE